MMVCETNRYAYQFLEANQLCRRSSMTGWKDTIKDAIKIFIGVRSYKVFKKGFLLRKRVFVLSPTISSGGQYRVLETAVLRLILKSLKAFFASIATCF